jgi:GTP-binding protein EngB required for normal cell division
MRLADVIGNWIGKVEIVLAGADDDLKEGESALVAGDAMRARSAAHRVLTLAPDSPVGLALLADACEAGHLDAELAQSLEELARRAPSRPEVWLRLARARQTTQAPLEEVRDAFVRALAVAESGSESRREALIGLADVDLAEADGERAQLWLERTADTRSVDVAVRRAEAKLLLGDAAAAGRLLDATDSPPTDGRAALARGRALAMLGEASAFVPLLRAMVLDVPGASEALSSALAYVPSDAQTRTRVRSVVDAKGEQTLARWRAAFARTEGDREGARKALLEAVRAGDVAAARALLDAAIEDHDPDALDAALHALPHDPRDPVIAEALLLARAFPVDGDRGTSALDAVAPVAWPRLTAWADAVVDEVARAWVPSSGEPANWPLLLARLDAHAHAIGDLATAGSVGDLATERARPLRLAIVGEFNAGKSTFINALMGAEVAPTGVLPTTATLHHLRWAPDPFAKVLFAKGCEPGERIVALHDLRSVLAASDPVSVRRVEIGMPIATLVTVEILDTPGFNASDPQHSQVARAAFEEADVAVWLFDATQAMKNSERDVLEEAKAAGLPVQILVNKVDRLVPSDVERVLGNVRAGLADIGIASWSPPVAFSARKALMGKLGDADALERSGWATVESLLEHEIVGRHGELKERALRRRASTLVARLVGVHVARLAGEAAAAKATAAVARAAAYSATRIEADASAIAKELAASLRPLAQAWARDLDLVFVGRDEPHALVDPVLARYRVDRALAALSPALSQALASLAPEASLPADRLGASARAIIRTAVSCSLLDLDDILAAIASAAVATLVDLLVELGHARTEPSRAAGALRELEAFARAL